MEGPLKGEKEGEVSSEAEREREGKIPDEEKAYTACDFHSTDGVDHGGTFFR